MTDRRMQSAGTIGPGDRRVGERRVDVDRRLQVRRTGEGAGEMTREMIDTRRGSRRTEQRRHAG